VFWDFPNVEEILDWVQNIWGQYVEVEPWIRWLQLEAFRDKPSGTLSGGTQQKVGLVVALMFDSPILILDEPTAGLDPLSNARFKERILHEKEKGKTIILTSHILSELEALADRVVFLLEGRLVFEGSRNDLFLHTGEASMERAVARLMVRVNGEKGE